MATYLVTVANRGIGYEYCRQLQAWGDKAIAVCPEASKELKALGIRVEENIDIADDFVASLHERLGATQIEVLINNAAMFAKRTAEGITKRITQDNISTLTVFENSLKSML
ncbi:short-chain dehydrogenase of unknown substrate specificity [Synechocystis sp. PCC 7509]|uniref:short-chain dehydrogenase of unknown substrate specificity n=1 Tax=Synechocystis sp. PCC 7509 TaxID=927677 RepID=UPI0002AC8837|nr:short-chain dehydrogenase of unknown substrate specificity [Synechocystis sp. PCC 7509]